MNVAVCVKQIPDPAVPGTLSADKTLERSDAGLAHATPEQPGPVYVPGGQIRQRTGPRIFVFDTDRTAGGGRQ